MLMLRCDVVEFLTDSKCPYYDVIIGFDTMHQLELVLELKVKQLYVIDRPSLWNL